MVAQAAFNITIDMVEAKEDMRRSMDSAKARLEQALTKTLSGFVTICAACKDIRHEGAWQA